MSSVYRIYDANGRILKQSTDLKEIAAAAKLISLFDKQLEMSVWSVDPSKDQICEDDGSIINNEEELVGTCFQGAWYHE